jgi:hypothetical protein
MMGDAYIPGALVVAHSLRAVKTRYALVCMVTDDVTDGARKQLATQYDAVIEVPYIVHAVRKMATKKQDELYASWVDRSFTKWNCLALAYARVAFVDADMVFTTNCDELFELKPPAAVFSSPWSRPWCRGGLTNPYLARGATDLQHAAVVPCRTVLSALEQVTFVGGGFLVVLSTSAGALAALRRLLDAQPIYGASHKTVSGADEAAICELYAAAGVPWTNIHQRYAAIPWKKKWTGGNARALHYQGRKPWDMAVGEWPDLADWWRVANALVDSLPDLRVLFDPRAAIAAELGPGLGAGLGVLDAEAAQLQLTRDICSLVVASTRQPRQSTRGQRHRPPNTDKKEDSASRRPRLAALQKTVEGLIGGWLVGIYCDRGCADACASAWAKVYRRSTLDEAPNAWLIAQLVEKKLARDCGEATSIVAELLSLVDLRVGRMPGSSRAQGACVASQEGTHISFSSHYRAPVTGQILQRVASYGSNAVVAAAMRYAAVCHDVCKPSLLPKSLADVLRGPCAVLNEAGTTPFDEHIGAAFFGLFSDTDAVLGSAGAFFRARMADYTGNWLIKPSPMHGLRFVQHVRAAFDAGLATTCFILLGAEHELAAHCAIRASPHFGAAFCSVFPPSDKPDAAVPMPDETICYAMCANPTARPDSATPRIGLDLVVKCEFGAVVDHDGTALGADGSSAVFADGVEDTSIEEFCVRGPCYDCLAPHVLFAFAGLQRENASRAASRRPQDTL